MMKAVRIFRGCGIIGLSWAMAAALPALEPVKNLEDLKRMETRVVAVGKKAMPATVALISAKTGASGSGVIVSEKGMIYTAAHVVEGNEEMDVVFPDGKQVKGKVLGANLSKDIAMMQIEGEGPWPFVEIGESKPLQAGDWVVAMGHSTGFDPNRKPPVRFGRVVSDGPGQFLTTDCTLIGGDSGGPLFDLSGKLVGINSSIGNSWINNNHAGVDGFKEDRERLLTGETWGELQMNPLANRERASLGVSLADGRMRQGVRITQVVPGGPADKAGLRADDVVLTINGTGVREKGAFMRQLAKCAAGDEVEFEVLREGETFTAQAKLIKLEELEKLER